MRRVSRRPRPSASLTPRWRRERSTTSGERETPPLLQHIPQIELFRETEALGLAPQVPEGEGVKGVDRQSLRTVQTQQADDAVLHLDRRLPGEGHGQDPARIDALPNQMHKAHGQGGRLARAGSGQGQLNGCVGGGGGAL